MCFFTDSFFIVAYYKYVVIHKFNDWCNLKSVTVSIKIIIYSTCSQIARKNIYHSWYYVAFRRYSYTNKYFSGNIIKHFEQFRYWLSILAELVTLNKLSLKNMSRKPVQNRSNYTCSPEKTTLVSNVFNYLSFVLIRDIETYVDSDYPCVLPVNKF